MIFELQEKTSLKIGIIVIRKIYLYNCDIKMITFYFIQVITITNLINQPININPMITPIVPPIQAPTLTSPSDIFYNNLMFSAHSSIAFKSIYGFLFVSFENQTKNKWFQLSKFVFPTDISLFSNYWADVLKFIIPLILTHSTARQWLR